jgi:hypothetical protein
LFGNVPKTRTAFSSCFGSQRRPGGSVSGATACLQSKHAHCLGARVGGENRGSREGEAIKRGGWSVGGDCRGLGNPREEKQWRGWLHLAADGEEHAARDTRHHLRRLDRLKSHFVHHQWSVGCTSRRKDGCAGEELKWSYPLACTRQWTIPVVLQLPRAHAPGSPCRNACTHISTAPSLAIPLRHAIR